MFLNMGHYGRERENIMMVYVNIPQEASYETRGNNIIMRVSFVDAVGKTHTSHVIFMRLLR